MIITGGLATCKTAGLQAACASRMTLTGQMFPVEQILALATKLRVERWAFKNNRFKIMERILSIPRNVAVQGQRAQRQLMRELRIPEKRTTRNVESPPVKTKRKAV